MAESVSNRHKTGWVLWRLDDHLGLWHGSCLGNELRGLEPSPAQRGSQLRRTEAARLGAGLIPHGEGDMPCGGKGKKKKGRGKKGGR